MPTHEELYTLAVRAAEDIYRDRSVDAAVIENALLRLRGEVERLIDLNNKEDAHADVSE